ncbi:MAG TPA: Spy/CpxP family protein refolding chaperone [Stellaceae bacterium]|nr:Spy/CpxP family protein refolding chaperone [Stellaceae bacterium]
MIFRFIQRSAGVLAAAAAIAIVLIGPEPAAAGNPQLAQAPAAPSAAPPASAPAAQPAARSKRSSASPEARVDAFLQRLHTRLHVTAAQEPLWNAYAQTVRDDAQARESRDQQKQQTAGTMTAVDDLTMYQKAVDTHAANVDKIVPAFVALYNSMSDSQKSTADAMFGHTHHHRAPAKKSG